VDGAGNTADAGGDVDVGAGADAKVDRTGDGAVVADEVGFRA